MSLFLWYIAFVASGSLMGFGLIEQARRGLSGKGSLWPHVYKLLALVAFFAVLQWGPRSVLEKSIIFAASAGVTIGAYLVARRKFLR